MERKVEKAIKKLFAIRPQTEECYWNITKYNREGKKYYKLVASRIEYGLSWAGENDCLIYSETKGWHSDFTLYNNGTDCLINGLRYTIDRSFKY